MLRDCGVSEDLSRSGGSNLVPFPFPRHQPFLESLGHSFTPFFVEIRNSLKEFVNLLLSGGIFFSVTRGRLPLRFWPSD